MEKLKAIRNPLKNNIDDKSDYRRRPVGRPKQRWMDKNKKELNQLGIDNIFEATLNRDKWKEICFAAMGLNGL